jgi:uncharacterized Tic20 family protein
MSAGDEMQLSNEPELPTHSSEERTWAALAHASVLLNFVVGLGGVIAAGVIWLIKKEESEWVGFHGLQSLVFQGLQLAVTLVVVGGTWVLGFAFSFLTLGFGTLIAVPLMFLTFFLGMLIMVAGLVYGLYGAYQVYNGQDFRYPWLGDWLVQRSSEPRQASLRSPAERDRSSKNTLLILIAVLVVLVLCVFCAIAGLIAFGILGGIFAYNASAWLPALFVLV